MIGGSLQGWMRAFRQWTAAHLPAPLAAPETARLRRLRLTLVGLLTLLAVLTALLDPLIAIARLAAALLWLGLAFSSAIVGLIWLRAKLRADDAWIMRERDE